MKKGYIITAVLVLVVVLVVVGVSLRGEIAGMFHGDDGTTAPPTLDTDKDGYMCMVKGAVENADPIMKTDLDGIYYTMKKDGAVSFFKVEGTQIAQIPESGTYDCSVTCSNQSIPATIHYIEQNGKISGYGLFTTDSSDASVYIYDYAFFHLMNLPDSYAADSSYLVLVDTTKEDFYRNDKVYEENFTFNTASGETKNILSNDNRAFDNTGAQRADYAMLTEDAVKICGENFLFFSARQYHLFTKDNNMDLYMAGGSGNNKDNNRYIQDIVDFYLRFDDEGRVVVLKRNGESAFRLIAFDGETETVIQDFSGSYAEKYLRSGDLLLNKETFELYNLLTGETKKLSVSNTNGFTADIFVADGNRVFLRGVSDGASAIALGDISRGCTCYYNEMFSRIFAPVVLADGSVMVSVADDLAGSGYSIKIFGTEAVQ